MCTLIFKISINYGEVTKNDFGIVNYILILINWNVS